MVNFRDYHNTVCPTTRNVFEARGTQDRSIEMPTSRNRQKSFLERKNLPSGYILHSQTGGLGLKHQHLQTQTAVSTRVQSTETLTDDAIR